VEGYNPAAGDQINMSTSTDGGITWGAAVRPSGSDFGLGGQPVVQPNGNVVVPFDGNGIQTFTSTNGGVTWGKVITISSQIDHAEAGGLRNIGLPVAAVDGGGTVYVAWQDCRFRTNCAENDIVLSTSTDGNTWSAPARVPEDPVTSTIDHFLPGLDADKTTSGSGAHLALIYYAYSQSKCTQSTCNMGVAFMSSANGGATWGKPVPLTSGPMKLTWLPSTDSGLMVGDYFSVSYVNGKAFGVFAVAKAKVGSTFNQAMYTTATGLGTPEGPTFSSAEDKPVPGAKSDHGPRVEHEERGVKTPPPPKSAKKSARK
jgi:hypothetical protein